MGDDIHSIDATSKLANLHGNLILDPQRDPVLTEGRSPFEAYDPALFTEVAGTRRTNIYTTWYADERRGTRFQGRLTAIAHQFNTYGFTAAVNSSLQGTFPLGSFVKVRVKSREVIVLITDTKGAEGLDLSKAAAYALGLTEPGTALRSEMTRVRPKDCAPQESTSRHPLAQCYPKDVYIEWMQLDQAIPATRTLAHRSSPFQLRYWRFAQHLKDLGMNRGTIARPFVRGAYARGRNQHVHLTTTVGPFASIASAEEYLTNACLPGNQRLAAGMAPFCKQATIRAENWRPKPWTIYYRKTPSPFTLPVAQRAPAKRASALDERGGAPD